MRRAVERGLVALALRRTACLGLCAWAVALALFAWITDTSGSGPGSVSHDPLHDEVRAGLSRQAVWIVFLLGVLPVVVVRAVTRAAPWHHGDAPWLATRAVSNTAIALSTWLGACCAGAALTAVFACVAEARGGPGAPVPVRGGSIELPARRGFAAGAPLAWSASLPESGGGTAASARVELGLSPGAGAACEVRLRARGRQRGEESFAIGRIGNRGALEVRLPRAETAVDFELSTAADGARVYLLSDRAELWSPGSSAHAAGFTLGARVALALCVWLAIALCFSCFVSAATAVLGVLALWTPLWFASEALPPWIARCVPGADLFDALATVGDGRAPAQAGLAVVAVSLVASAAALSLCASGLPRWRVAR